MSRELELEQIRAAAQALVNRAKGDPDFRERAMRDPVGVSREAGLPDKALPDFFREQGIDAEVVGYRPGDDPECVDFTCIVSLCPDTCLGLTAQM